MDEFRRACKQKIENSEGVELFRINKGEDQPPKIKINRYHASVHILRDIISRAPFLDDSAEVVLLNPDNLHFGLNFMNGGGVLLRAEIYYGYVLIGGKWFDTLNFRRFWEVLTITTSLEGGAAA